MYILKLGEKVYILVEVFIDFIKFKNYDVKMMLFNVKFVNDVLKLEVNKNFVKINKDI